MRVMFCVMEVRDAGCNSNTESCQRLGYMVQETETVLSVHPLIHFPLYSEKKILSLVPVFPLCDVRLLKAKN